MLDTIEHPKEILRFKSINNHTVASNTNTLHYFLDFRIHPNYEHLIQKAHNETVTLEAYVPWFSCFDIEFKWKLIKNEDDINNEEIDLPEHERFRVNSEVRSRSTLTISSITVQDEAEYVCRANLKCWRRIADRYATKLIVRGGKEKNRFCGI